MIPKKFHAILSRLIVASLFLALGGCGIFSSNNRDETAGWSAQQLYSTGKDEMTGGGYDAAIGYFDKIRSRYPFGTYAQQAEIDTIYSYYRLNNNDEALKAIDNFIRQHPNNPNVDYVMYMRGLVNFNDRVSLFDFIAREDLSERDPKAARDAFDAFKMLIDRFPNSKYAPDAIARMKYLVDALARYDVHVASYYYRRGAYVAAVNRAQHAVKTYPSAPAVYDALTLMVQSYNAMGLTQLRDDTDRVLKTTYPNGPTNDPVKSVKKPWWKIW